MNHETPFCTPSPSSNALGEWGFAALVEVDERRILFDTGKHADVALKDTQTLGIELSTIPDVVLSHSHDDHVGGC